MKRLIPFFIAVILIVLIGAGYAGTVVMERYSYSQEKADLQSYFHLSAPDQVAILMGDEVIEEQGKLMDGVCYFDQAMVERFFTDRFYEDTSVGEVLYALPDSLISVPVGGTTVRYGDSVQDKGYIPVRKEGETLYFAVDFLKDFANFTSEIYLDPNRIQLDMTWEEHQTAAIKKHTQVRYQGGIKSEILTEVSKGDRLYVLEQMDEWSKVKTTDGFIGYVENKRLEDFTTVNPIPATNYVEPDYSGNTRDYTVSMAWHNVAGKGGNDTIYAFLQDTQGINVVSPTWIHISDNDGNVIHYASESYVEDMHSRGIEVWALVSNFMNEANIDDYAVLSNQTSRTRLIDQIMEVAITYQLDGLNIDFEQLGTETGAPFVEFLRELSIRTRAAGLVLSVDNYVPMGGLNAHYNLKEQGVVADYVVIMGYDEHYAGSSEAGSVASIGYVENGIANVCAQVPAKKVINGIPFYTRIWATTGAEVSSQAVDMDVAQQWLRDHNITTQWDDVACQNYGEYTNGSTIYQCWLEDEESIGVKLSVMKNFEIGGVAEWRLGQENKSIWSVIADYVGAP